MSEYIGKTVACAAQTPYGHTPERVRRAAHSFNTIFEVTTASARYALRVGSRLRIHPAGTAAVEVAWHRMLRGQGVNVPGVLANSGGEFTTVVADASTPRVCVLFDWVPGYCLASHVTQGRSAQLGRLSARLHQEAAAWAPPGDGDVLTADRVLYWLLPDRLAEAGTRFGYGSLFTDAAARAQSVLDALWRDPPHPPHLVHGDLTPGNVIVSPQAGLVPIDFQDTIVGLEVQDLSITMAALRRTPGGERLAAAFRAGYEACRPWPDVSPDRFESLVAARWLHQMNLTLNTADLGKLDGYVAGHAERARAWLRRPAGSP